MSDGKEAGRKRAWASKTKCPHKHIQYCPLYIAAHEPTGFGCIDDLAEPCRVERGEMDYALAVEKYRAVNPREVAGAAFREEAAKAREQRNRNMRANGVQ